MWLQHKAPTRVSPRRLSGHSTTIGLLQDSGSGAGVLGLTRPFGSLCFLVARLTRDVPRGTPAMRPDFRLRILLLLWVYLAWVGGVCFADLRRSSLRYSGTLSLGPVAVLQPGRSSPGDEDVGPPGNHPEKTSFTQVIAEADASEDAREGESGEEYLEEPEEDDAGDEQRGPAAGVPPGKEPEPDYESDTEGATGTSPAAAPAAPSVQFDSAPMKLAHDTPRVGYADGQEACSAIGCQTVASGAGPKNPITGCAKGVKCTRCFGRRETEARCQAWKPSSRPDIVLANGWFTSKHSLSRAGAVEVDVKWDHNSELDFSKCMPDLRQVTQSYKELQETGNVRPFPFYRMVSVQLAVFRLPSDGMKDDGPKKMSFSVKYVDPHSSSLLTSGSASGARPICGNVEALIPIVNLPRKTAMYGVGWLPVPKDKTYSITTRNFVIRMQCSGVQACNLSKIGICARISCPGTVAAAEAQVAAAQRAMSNPVGDTPLDHPGAASAAIPTTAGAPHAFQAATGRVGFPPVLQAPRAYFPGTPPYFFAPRQPFYSGAWTVSANASCGCLLIAVLLGALLFS